MGAVQKHFEDASLFAEAWYFRSYFHELGFSIWLSFKYTGYFLCLPVKDLPTKAVQKVFVVVQLMVFTLIQCLDPYLSTVLR